MTSTVSRVGRRPEYTAEQDALILAISDSAELNRRFVEMGMEPKDRKAIAARRQYLKKTGFASHSATPIEARLTHLMAMRRTLEDEVEDTSRRLTDLVERRQDVDQEIVLLQDELTQTLSEGSPT